jgi:hypothetical protein
MEKNKETSKSIITRIIECISNLVSWNDVVTFFWSFFNWSKKHKKTKRSASRKRIKNHASNMIPNAPPPSPESGPFRIEPLKNFHSSSSYSDHMVSRLNVGSRKRSIPDNMMDSDMFEESTSRDPAELGEHFAEMVDNLPPKEHAKVENVVEEIAQDFFSKYYEEQEEEEDSSTHRLVDSGDFDNFSSLSSPSPIKKVKGQLTRFQDIWLNRVRSEDRNMFDSNFFYRKDLKNYYKYYLEKIAKTKSYLQNPYHVDVKLSEIESRLIQSDEGKEIIRLLKEIATEKLAKKHGKKSRSRSS